VAQDEEICAVLGRPKEAILPSGVEKTVTLTFQLLNVDALNRALLLVDDLPGAAKKFAD